MTRVMKGSLFTCLTTLLVIGFAAVAKSKGMMGGNCMGMLGGSTGSMVRHHEMMMGGVPEAYRSLTNPLPANTEIISRGRAIYGDQCASCHGPSGLGDGEDGRELSPRPANLASLTHADDDGRLLSLLDDCRRW